jgi:hypothetical protein
MVYVIFGNEDSSASLADNMNRDGYVHTGLDVVRMVELNRDVRAAEAAGRDVFITVCETIQPGFRNGLAVVTGTFDEIMTIVNGWKDSGIRAECIFSFSSRNVEV